MKASLALAALLMLEAAGCKEEARSIPPRPVLTMTIRPESSRLLGPFTSTIEARYETQLGFQTSGRVIARNFDVSNFVRKGQELAALDPTVPQFLLVRAKADLADARAQLVTAQGEASRKQTLMKTGGTSQAALDAATAGLQTGKARELQALAAVRVSEEQLSYTKLLANFDGIITSWSAVIGQFVSQGQAVVKIARPDVREAVVDVSDDQIGQLRTEMVFDVGLLGAPNVKTRARVREIGPLADSVTRTHRVRMTLEGSNSAFLIGSTVSVVSNAQIPPKIVIPKSVVGERDGRPFVWLLAKSGASVVRRDVTLEGTEGDSVVVGSGLAADDRIVTIGIHSLSDGQKVNGSTGYSPSKAASAGP